MFGKLAKHHQFDYTPRFYDPTKEEKKRPRIKFHRMSHKTKTRSFIWMIAIAVFIIYIIIALSKVAIN